MSSSAGRLACLAARAWQQLWSNVTACLLPFLDEQPLDGTHKCEHSCKPTALPCTPYCSCCCSRAAADVVVLHDALDFGQCHLALGVPTGGRFADINTLEQLRAMPWSEQAPLRCGLLLSACRGAGCCGVQGAVTLRVDFFSAGG